jgi:hypothetical protein
VCAAGTHGAGGKNLARRRRGSAGGPESLFRAGGAKGELDRGASSPEAAAPKGGRRGKERFLGLILPAKRARGRFSNVSHGASAPDRVLPRRANAGTPTVYLGSNRRRHVFGRASGAPIWTPESKIRAGRILGSPVEML